MVRSDSHPLAPLGLSVRDEQVYRTALRHAGDTLPNVAAFLGSSLRQAERELSSLAALGLLRLVEGRVVVEAPDEPVRRLVAERASRLQQVESQLVPLRALLPADDSVEPGAEDPPARRHLVVGQLVSGVDVAALLSSLFEESSGDLMWLRPDQWQLASAARVDELVRRGTEAGRRSRAIYPARVLELSPETVLHRSALGEEVRIIAEVPTRMVIVGDGGAVLPERWGTAGDRRLVVRHQSMVMSLHQLFDRMWQRAIPVPGVEAARRGSPRESERRLLVQELGSGAKDEQIARALGVGLRTVRRRVAALLDELGVESRFQAGVEAARRGWL